MVHELKFDAIRQYHLVSQETGQIIILFVKVDRLVFLYQHIQARSRIYVTVNKATIYADSGLSSVWHQNILTPNNTFRSLLSFELLKLYFEPQILYELNKVHIRNIQAEYMWPLSVSWPNNEIPAWKRWFISSQNCHWTHRWLSSFLEEDKILVSGCHAQGISSLLANALRPRQNGHHFPDDIFERIFSMKMYEFQLKVRWCLFLSVQLATFQSWFR